MTGIDTAATVAASTLTVKSVPGYLAGRPVLRALIAPDMTVSEVGDGNLNQVFICRGSDGRSLVLKQALPYVRLVGPSWPMTEERATREAAAIRVHSSLSEFVCRMVDYDPERYVIALEDLSDHTVMRAHLNSAGRHDGIAERLGRYVADVFFGTSFLGLGEEAFRSAAAAATNTDLCLLTEDVIFTEPFLGADRNSVHPEVAPLVSSLQADPDWVDAAMIMKRRFLTVQEAHLHGDLHTGSVFVRYDGDVPSVKTFDSEFAFYGPVGFDLGLLWANLLAAGVRARILGDDDRGRSLFAAVAQSWESFRARVTELWPMRWAPEKYPDSLLRDWLTDIRIDACGFAGCEAARRIIGLAKISDVQTLDAQQHVRAARAVLGLSRLLLTRRADLDFEELTAAAVDESAG